MKNIYLYNILSVLLTILKTSLVLIRVLKVKKKCSDQLTINSDSQNFLSDGTPFYFFIFFFFYDLRSPHGST